jgi:type I site-specific restriction endonuclease
MPAYHSFNEAQTRYGLIDPQLTKRGWNLADRRSVSLEVPVDGITDYCLYRSNGEVLAVIEAKRTRKDARLSKEQLYQYIIKIEKRQSFHVLVFSPMRKNLVIAFDKTFGFAK